MTPVATQLTKRRWVMLFLFTSYSMCNAFQWLQYGIINNIFMRFYNVNSFAIDWMSMVSMLTYIPFIFPTIWLLDKTGLRVMAIVASSINCLGAWIKVASVRPNLFWVTMLGQFAAALSQVFILGMPSRVASVWFGPDEVSSATSIGVAGSQESERLEMMNSDLKSQIEELKHERQQLILMLNRHRPTSIVRTDSVKTPEGEGNPLLEQLGAK